jgi:MFS family permease
MMNRLKLKIGILSISTLSMSALVVTSAFGAMIQYFSHVSPTTVQMIGSLPSLGALIVTLLVGWLAQWMSKKKLALCGIACIAVGGLLPILYFSNIGILLACALLVGVGVGFITTVIPMLLSMYFAEGEERAAIMGMSTAINALGAMVLMVLGGILGGKYWSHTYYAYLLSILIFVLVLWFVPVDSIPAKKVTNNSHLPSTKHVLLDLNKYIYALSFLTFCISFVYTIYLTNISVLLLDKQIGGTALTGIINGVGTLGGIVTGFCIKYIRKFIPHNALATGFLMMFLSFALVFFANNLIVLLIGSIFSGIAMCLIMSTAPYEISMLAKPEQIAPSMSIFIFASSCGGIISPIVLRMLHVSVGYEAFILGMIVTMVITLAVFVSRFGKRLANIPDAAETH